MRIGLTVIGRIPVEQIGVTAEIQSDDAVFIASSFKKCILAFRVLRPGLSRCPQLLVNSGVFT
jgi:hypothetical protein